MIARYGLAAIFLGAGVEGEPFALAGGALAQRHWLSPYAVTLAAIAGSCFIDQMWFHLSRNFRQSRAVQRLVARPAFRRSLAMIERHPVRFVLLFRFAYGLRAITAVAVGASGMSTRLFVGVNILAATLWGLAFTALGYGAGPLLVAAQARYGFVITAMSVCVSALVVVLVLRRARR
jgi:membrane protein DedA with SNARE-associated domain